MTFTLSNFVTTEDRQPDGRTWFLVDAAVAYPETIARLREFLTGDELPAELMGSSNPDVAPAAGARLAISRIRQLPDEAFDWALIPFEKFSADPRNHENTVEVQGRLVSPIICRALALELARLWFTRALKLQHGPIGVHISNAPAFKLGANVAVT